MRDVVVVHAREGAWELPSFCPASVSVLAYLRLSRIAFSESPCSSSSTSPSGSLPVLESGDELVGNEDTSSWRCEWDAAASILDHLARTRVDLDSCLTPHEKALKMAYAALVDSKLLPATVFSTWVSQNSWRNYTQAAYGAGLPFPASRLVPWRRRREMLRHFADANEGQLVEDAACVYAALAAQLEARGPFLFGDKPSSLDMTVFAHLLYHRNAPMCSRLRVELHKHNRLTEYVQHIFLSAFVQPLPPAPVDNYVPPPSAGSSHNPGTKTSKARTAKEERFKRRGRQWLGFAAVVVLGYVLLSGSYIEMDPDMFYEDEDDDM
eukprot:jgi/Tetstr1/460937/TSEL_006089.t1